MINQTKCPICEGHGQVPGGFYTTLPGCCGVSTAVAETCRNCCGTGVVYVEQWNSENKERI